MRKKMTILATVGLAAVLLLAGCGGGSTSNVIQDQINNVTTAIGQMLAGDTKGEVSKDYHTQWFTFNVKSIKGVDSYAGYTPAEGMQLVDVVVSEENIFSDPIPMGTFDFYLDADSFQDYVYPMSPLDDTMMPDEFELAPGERVEYHMVYEVPVDVSAMKLMYTEIDETEAEGATFTIDFTL